MFNEGRYFERMLAGEFRAVIVSQNRRRRGDRQVRGMMSQTVDYWDDQGHKVARVHQYRKKDGTLGASGKPDPKVLRVGDILYALDQGEQWDLPKW